MKSKEEVINEVETRMRGLFEIDDNKFRVFREIMALLWVLK